MRPVRVFLAALPLAALAACATQDPPAAEGPTYQAGYAKGCNWSSLYPGVAFGWQVDAAQIDKDPAFRKGLRDGMDACGFADEAPTMADYLPLPGMGHISLADDLSPEGAETGGMAEEPASPPPAEGGDTPG